MNLLQDIQHLLIVPSVKQKLGAFVEEVYAKRSHAKSWCQDKGEKPPGGKGYEAHVVREVQAEDTVGYSWNGRN